MKKILELLDDYESEMRTRFMNKQISACIYQEDYKALELIRNYTITGTLCYPINLRERFRRLSEHYAKKV